MYINGKPAPLGKKKVRIDPRTLQFANYMAAAKLLYPPPTADWTSKVTRWPMYSNDTLGDCVEAAAGHMIELWETYANSTERIPTDAQIIAAYSGAAGYVPGNPNTDQGTDMLTFLNYWRKTGVGGHKIVAYVALTTGSLVELRQAVQLFGCAMIGVALPVTAQGAETWTVVDPSLQGNGAPGSWGGHCIPVAKYDYVPPNTIRNTVVTWGQTLPMSNAFYRLYSDEAYVALSQDWIDHDALAPSGFDVAQLQADLAAL